MKSNDPTSLTLFLLRAAQLPGVPADLPEVQARAGRVTRRVPEAQQSALELALTEIESRGVAHAGELGDLGPDPAQCGELARGLRQGYEVIGRLEALLVYARAWCTVNEATAAAYVTDACEQATMRIERGRLPAESYVHARRFVAARGEAIVQGRAKAKRARAAAQAAAEAAVRPAAPANGTHDVKKTGSDDR